MDFDQARARLLAERAEVEELLADTESAQAQERNTGDGPGDVGDAALPLTSLGNDEAVAGTLRDRLDAISRALTRLDEGTYGRSVRSGEPIPAERLEADPAAELTVEEAEAPT
jgi:RNA polymerase-binding transcription factor